MAQWWLLQYSCSRWQWFCSMPMSLPLIMSKRLKLCCLPTVDVPWQQNLVPNAFTHVIEVQWTNYLTGQKYSAILMNLKRGEGRRKDYQLRLQIPCRLMHFVRRGVVLRVCVQCHWLCLLGLSYLGCYTCVHMWWHKCGLWLWAGCVVGTRIWPVGETIGKARRLKKQTVMKKRGNRMRGWNVDLKIRQNGRRAENTVHILAVTIITILSISLSLSPFLSCMHLHLCSCAQVAWWYAGDSTFMLGCEP